MWGDYGPGDRCRGEKGREGIDFFPLTVVYLEMTYAAGKITGGYFKREGRPTEKEILTARFIDRPIRTVVPKGFTAETQISRPCFRPTAKTIRICSASTGPLRPCTSPTFPLGVPRRCAESVAWRAIYS